MSPRAIAGVAAAGWLVALTASCRPSPDPTPLPDDRVEPSPGDPIGPIAEESSSTGQPGGHATTNTGTETMTGTPTGTATATGTVTATLAAGMIMTKSGTGTGTGTSTSTATVTGTGTGKGTGTGVTQPL